DDLRAQGLVPLQEPYSAMGFNVEGPTSTSSALLAITGTNAVVDWVLVESRSATDPQQILSTRAGLLLRNGSVVSPVNGNDPLNMCLPMGSYYVVVRHRNHLPCMTANAISPSPIGTIVDLRALDPPLYLPTYGE